MLLAKLAGAYYRLPLETLEASSGWIASPIDLLRFTRAIDGRNERSPRFEQSLVAVDDFASRSAVVG